MGKCKSFLNMYESFKTNLPELHSIYPKDNVAFSSLSAQSKYFADLEEETGDSFGKFALKIWKMVFPVSFSKDEKLPYEYVSKVDGKKILFSAEETGNGVYKVKKIKTIE